MERLFFKGELSGNCSIMPFTNLALSDRDSSLNLDRLLRDVFF